MLVRCRPSEGNPQLLTPVPYASKTPQGTLTRQWRIVNSSRGTFRTLPMSFRRNRTSHTPPPPVLSSSSFPSPPRSLTHNHDSGDATGAGFMEMDFGDGHVVALDRTLLEPTPLASDTPLGGLAIVNDATSLSVGATQSMFQDYIEDIIDIFHSNPTSNNREAPQPMPVWSEARLTSDRHSSYAQPLSTPPGAQSKRFRSYQQNEWQSKYKALVIYSKEYGHCDVPQASSKHSSLAMWVKRQRYQYSLKKAGKSSTLSEEREELLNELGFVWDRQQAQWEEHLLELKEFRKKHGHCRVPSGYRDNKSLASWVKVQRRTCTLPGNEIRFKKLDDIGFWE